MVSTDSSILKLGRGRATRYALRRDIADLPVDPPLFRVDAEGVLHRLGVLTAIAPDLLVARLHDHEEVFEDLPWFLQDARPMGYLGRLVPRRHPELGLPEDIRRWRTEHGLAWMARRGWNLPGDLILGEEAAERWLAVSTPPDAVEGAARRTRYPIIADDVAEHGPVGSSAAGEQAKFLATRDGVPVLVKFSPARDDLVARRIADLLVAEHLALVTLAEGGVPAPDSEILCAGGRTFLEVERFDRVGSSGRRGVVSLEALDGAFVGGGGDWSETVEALVRARIVAADAVEATRLRQSFGALIANTDMHAGNLSFWREGLAVGGLTPVYDMLPMAYAPRAGEVRRSPWPSPDPSPWASWRTAWELACTLWDRVSGDARVSPGFQDLARTHLEALRAQSPRIARLPRASSTDNRA